MFTEVIVDFNKRLDTLQKAVDHREHCHKGVGEHKWWGGVPGDRRTAVFFSLWRQNV